MSDYEVTLVNDNMQEFYVRFHGPQESESECAVRAGVCGVGRAIASGALERGREMICGGVRAGQYSTEHGEVGSSSGEVRLPLLVLVVTAASIGSPSGDGVRVCFVN